MAQVHIKPDKLGLATCWLIGPINRLKVLKMNQLGSNIPKEKKSRKKIILQLKPKEHFTMSISIEFHDLSY